jgi:antigen flippase
MGRLKSINRLRREWMVTGIRSDYISTFVTTGVIQVFGVVTGIITARILGPEGKGDLATILWLPNLMTAIGLISLPQAVTYISSQSPSEYPRLTNTGFWISLGIGSIEAILLYPLVPFVLGPGKQELISLSRWFLFYLPAAFSGLALLGVDQGRQKFFRYNVMRILPAIFYLVPILALWRIGRASLANVLYANLFAQVIASIIRVLFSFKAVFRCQNRSHFRLARMLLRQGITFFMPTLCGILLMRLDIALLSWKVASIEVGFYSAALAIAMGQTGLSTSLVLVNFPKVASRGSAESLRVLSKQLKKAVLPILGLGLFVAACSPLIIRYLFGRDFLPSVSIAFILIPAISIWGLGQIIDNGLRGLGLGMPGTIANMVGIIALLSSAFPLMKYYDALGMAIAMLISQGVSLVVLMVYLSKQKWPERIIRDI